MKRILKQEQGILSSGRAKKRKARQVKQEIKGNQRK